MARDLPDKLDLTLLALQCRTQKELLGRLLAVNPETSFRPERAYKWSSGVASPRDPSVFDDLAAALGLDQGGKFYATATLGEFVAVLCLLYPALRAEAEARLGTDLAEDKLRSWVGRPESATAPPVHLTGRYLCVSPAWSVTRVGQLILGTLDIEAARDRCRILYREEIGGAVHIYSGEFYLSGRVIHGMLYSEVTEIPVFFSLNIASRPAVCLSGIFAGAAANDPITRPCGCRIYALRLNGPASQRDDAPKGYVKDRPALAAALASYGFGPEGCDAVAQLLFATLLSPEREGIVDMPLDVGARVGTLLLRMADTA